LRIMILMFILLWTFC